MPASLTSQDSSSVRKEARSSSQFYVSASSLTV
jgi:hypothetical protein